MATSSTHRLMLAALTASAVSTVTGSTCSTVATLTTINIDLPFTYEYDVQQTEYWSTACGNLKPTCIINPKTAEEVAAVISILQTNNETFAVKSGGHNPNNYFASVAGGPLISTKKLNEVILDEASETVRVGAGNRWDDVMKALDGTGFTAVGGRIGNVGVGGYMLGGGLSFMSTEYGWAANSVLQYTLVLANASVVQVDENNYPDVFLSLKGGGNAYGIVTSYLLQAYRQGEVWGGNLVFEANNKTTPPLLAALRDFTQNYPDDKAGVIMTSERTLGTLANLWILFLFYNGPEPPPGVFDNFTAVGPSTNSCMTRSMKDLLSFNNWAIVRGSVYTIGTETTPLPSQEYGAEIMGSYYDHWVNVSNTAALVPGLIASIAFQPLPKIIASLAKSKGGDLMDLDDKVDRIVIELDYSFLFNTDYPQVDATMRETYTGLQSLVKQYQVQDKLPKAYLPLFMNDAFYPQDYFGRLRPEKAALARRVRDELDPEGLWRNRTGGFNP